MIDDKDILGDMMLLHEAKKSIKLYRNVVFFFVMVSVVLICAIVLNTKRAYAYGYEQGLKDCILKQTNK